MKSSVRLVKRIEAPLYHVCTTPEGDYFISFVFKKKQKHLDNAIGVLSLLNNISKLFEEKPRAPVDRRGPGQRRPTRVNELSEQQFVLRHLAQFLKETLGLIPAKSRHKYQFKVQLWSKSHEDTDYVLVGTCLSWVSDSLSQYIDGSKRLIGKRFSLPLLDSGEPHVWNSR